MLTCEEFVNEYRKTKQLPPNNEIWLHALDATKHCLRGDYTESIYQSTNIHMEQFHEWREAMLNRTEWDQQFQEIVENSYEPKEQWEEVYDYVGDFDLTSYLNGEQQVFTDWEKINYPGPAISVVYDMNVPWIDRNRSYMEERHRKVYKIVAQCESENRPCRVICVMNDKITELTDSLKLFFVVKNYDDPIFPAIWGTFVDNRVTNAFGNVVNDFLIGTASFGNGRPVALHKIRQYFPQDEELILFGKDLIDD